MRARPALVYASCLLALGTPRRVCHPHKGAAPADLQLHTRCGAGLLSGGEKARVALAVFALVPANVLLLDEASNHLDTATIDVLTGALQGFGGAIIAITHNPGGSAWAWLHVPPVL